MVTSFYDKRRRRFSEIVRDSMYTTIENDQHKGLESSETYDLIRSSDSGIRTLFALPLSVAARSNENGPPTFVQQ